MCYKYRNMALAEMIMAMTSILLLSLTSPPIGALALAPAPAPAPAVVNLTDLLAHAGPFLTFLGHIRDTQVIETFQDRANVSASAAAAAGITIFAPSDSAFSSLDTTPPLSNLTRDQLQSLLLFHALPEYYTLTDLSKNLTGTAAATLAGAGPSYSLNITDSAGSGTIAVDSGWTRTAITSSVYATAPVALYAVGQVLIPEAIFGAAPPAPPPPPPPPPRPPALPPSAKEDQGPTPEPVQPKDKDSSSSKAGIAASLLILPWAFLISSSMIIMY